jgi:hypothetical protein
MADEEQLIYPQAYLALDGGDLVECTDFNTGLTLNAKQKHTLRKRGSGIAWGTEESTVTYNSLIPETGPERAYWKDAKARRIKQIRMKIPGGAVMIYNGAYDQVNLNGPLDDATTVSVVFKGHLTL